MKNVFVHVLSHTHTHTHTHIYTHIESIKLTSNIISIFYIFFRRKSTVYSQTSIMYQSFSYCSFLYLEYHDIYSLISNYVHHCSSAKKALFLNHFFITMFQQFQIIYPIKVAKSDSIYKPAFFNNIENTK